MDCAASIERRIAAIKVFHDAGVRTTCFISPIFPGITDPKEIIRRTKNQCNLVWLENLNLRGAYKSVIMQWIRMKENPAAAAVYGASRSRTRAERDAPADAIAAKISAGTKRMGMVTDHGVERIAAVFAALKTGAAYASGSRRYPGFCG